MDINNLRKQLITQRKQLTANDVQQASIAGANHFIASPLFRNAEMIAYYCAADGEFDPFFIAKLAQKHQKKHCLPVLDKDDFRQMEFHQYEWNSKLYRNRFGIGEPAVTENSFVPISAVNVILVPLVAFDRQGNRLGRGAGCYDRFLAKIDECQSANRPVLIGVGYDFQQVDRLCAQAWDVPMDYFLTETQLFHAEKNSERDC